MPKRVDWVERKATILDILYCYWPIAVSTVQLQKTCRDWGQGMSEATVRRVCLELVEKHAIAVETIGGDYRWKYVTSDGSSPLFVTPR